uniref:Uncharacterized protein n=1 Tax=Megaselia scalaris TaxID=36166 RepID=T1GFF9_MEGSC
MSSSVGTDYADIKLKQTELSLILKARCDVLGLNINRFGENAGRRCSMCNLNALENVYHLMGACTINKFESPSRKPLTVVKLLEIQPAGFTHF